MITHWQHKSFAELDVATLYQIMKLRQQVFVVEQKCVYLDLDDHDQAATHILGWDGAVLAAYARILPAGIKHQYCAIGRVATAPTHRGQGLGKSVMQHALDQVRQMYGAVPVYVQAQKYLADSLYAGLGFKPTGDVYDEDGIPHQDMVLMPQA